MQLLICTPLTFKFEVNQHHCSCMHWHIIHVRWHMHWDELAMPRLFQGLQTFQMFCGMLITASAFLQSYIAKLVLDAYSTAIQ